MEKVIVNIAVLILKLISRLPLGVNQLLGRLLGGLLWRLNTKAVRVTKANITCCYPDKTEAEVAALSKKSVRDMAHTMFEMAFIWFAPTDKVLKTIVITEGEELIAQSRENGRGVLLLGPHLGNWEITGLYLASKYKMASMYKPPLIKEYEKFILAARSKTGAELVPTSQRGVARLLSILKKGGVVGVLPDQVPPNKSGEFAPFFGREALTMVLISKMLQKVDVDVYSAYCLRLPESKGYKLVIRKVDEAIYSADLSTSLAGLNHSVEMAVADGVEQYQWEYKRFRRLAPGQQSIY